MSQHSGRFTFLGTGSSGGVPVIACSCPVCSSTLPHNKRFRSSGLLEIHDQKLLVDVGPDFRMQALTNHITSLDALFLTHTHYDHVGGMEELRAFTLHTKRKMKCFLSKESLDSIQKLFFYHFTPKASHSNRSAEFEFHVLDKKVGEFIFADTPFRYFSYIQGSMPVLGFRVGGFAYLTDLKSYREELLQELQGLDILVTSALRFDSSRVQMNVDEAVSFIQKVAPKTAYLIHMSHELDFSTLKNCLPSHISPAYDGLEIHFPL